MRTVPVLALISALLLSSLVIAAPAGRENAPIAAADAGSITNHVVSSFDGTLIAVSAFRPAGASSEDPVPIVLHSHGWSGSRATTLTGIVERLVGDGFGVISIDARGHGESGSIATVHHKDTEIRDFILVLDWIHDNLEWVQKETETGIAKDIRAGATGYSYGGAFQLLTASYDRRLDAIAPEITWSDLNDALAPQGAVKSVWVDALMGLAYSSGTRMDPRIPAWYQEGLITNQLPQAAYDHFTGALPVLSAIEADVLLIQGVPDVLFNMNQAVRTYRGIESNGHGADVRIFTHLTGHVLPNQPLGTGFTRRVPFEIETPCGNLHDVVARWLDEKLRDGPASGLAEVSFALDNGECITQNTFPETSLTIHVPVTPAPSAAGTLIVPLLSGPAIIAGIPHMSATSLAAIDGMTYVGFVIIGSNGYTRAIDDQVMPIRLGHNVDIDTDLVGIAARLNTGDTLALRIEGINEWYAHNSARTPGGALLTNLDISLPLIQE